MPATTITLTSGVTSITLPGPSGSTEVATLPRYVSAVSANHKRWSYTLASASHKLNQWFLQLSALTGTQKTNLQDFFDNTVAGPTNTFTYVHTDGTSYSNVRFAETDLRWTRDNGEFWSTAFRIEMATAVS